MEQPFLTRAHYRLLFGLLGVVYLFGLFVPLMDHDSAHHADIALRMYLTGDYVNLMDKGRDYLDKPHLHFWLSAFSYELFGVTGFAYKFPSFLFTLLGTYATYRLGRTLYGEETGRLAALVVATAFGYILANNDVRMDAILTASIVLATWQGVEWIERRQWPNALGLALGLALGFSTKGHIAVAVPGVGLLLYMAYRRAWRVLLHRQVVLILLAFALFISPVVYCYYLQYDLHPEKVVRGRNNISGVQFILWSQNTERLQGDSFGASGKNDYLFFFHSFLWAFAPWCLTGFWTYASRLKSFFTRRHEWLTPGSFTVVLLLVTFSGFKLPHYLNIIFPVTAVMTASWLLEQNNRRYRTLLLIQAVLCSLVLLAAILLNAWALPVQNWAIGAGMIAIAIILVLLLRKQRTRLQRLVVVSAGTSILAWFSLNANFYPRLLSYQSGNGLAPAINREADGAHVYFWEGSYRWSLNFYTRTVHQDFHDSLLHTGKPVWIAAPEAALPDIQARYRTGRIFAHNDYRVSVLSARFLNPARRNEVLERFVVAEVLGRK
ncbi:MAG TPA: glycosyltransferase family 39 protein [Chitinophagaceae bacterium]|nr:glycosyltransferase family 39 protein [Chitinophagaceae bacterium]